MSCGGADWIKLLHENKLSDVDVDANSQLNIGRLTEAISQLQFQFISIKEVI